MVRSHRNEKERKRAGSTISKKERTFAHA